MLLIYLFIAAIVGLQLFILFAIADLRGAVHRWHKIELDSDKRLLEEYKIFNAAMKQQCQGRVGRG